LLLFGISGQIFTKKSQIKEGVPEGVSKYNNTQRKEGVWCQWHTGTHGAFGEGAGVPWFQAHQF
jgi:hypothetical protein